MTYDRLHLERHVLEPPFDVGSEAGPQLIEEFAGASNYPSSDGGPPQVLVVRPVVSYHDTVEKAHEDIQTPVGYLILRAGTVAVGI